MTPTTGPIQPAFRPYAVFDGAGEQLGLFASWPVAHEWAHIAAGMPGAVLPIEVEDRAARTTQRVAADGCEQVRWVAAGTAVCACPPPSQSRSGVRTQETLVNRP